MTPKSIDTLIRVAHLAQQNGLLQLKDTKFVLEAVEEGERELSLSNKLLELAGAEKVDNSEVEKTSTPENN